MNTFRIPAFMLSLLLFSSCTEEEKTTSILVKNTLDIERSFETIELSKGFLNIEDLSSIGIRDGATKQLQITQLVDNDGDGIMDDILFQPQLAPNSEKTYTIVSVTEAEKLKTKEYCYSRFVPERTDDYTWENNKVAFRVFGPTAQKMKEDGVDGGTLSSGVDAWLKKVDYPIINKWYKKNTEVVGSYHIDSGEGLDNFHVGSSRGVGGIAVKQDSVYYYSKNYTKWRTITTGPIRTSFSLDFEDWSAGSKSVKESRIVSLDFGSNLSKHVVSIGGVNEISAGLTLHEKDGEVTGNTKKGWVSYWQPHADSELGTAIVAPLANFSSYEKYDTEVTDLSNAYAHLKVVNSSVTYYSGFAWKESGQFKTQKDWENYLNQFSDKIESPIMVELVN